MTDIFGVAHLEGHAIPEPDVRAFAQAARLPAPCSVTTCAARGAVGGLVERRPFPTVRLTQGSPRDTSHDVVIAVEARLDNRDDLLAALSIARPDWTSIDDDQLAAMAFHAWGRQAARRVLGDWSIALWSPERRELLLARDASGNTSLFIWHDAPANRVLFASNVRALYAMGAPKAVNELALARWLTRWHDGATTETLDLAIQRLPPAHVCIVRATGPRFEQYWDPDDIDEAAGGSDDDWYEGLREVLDTAVQARCRDEGGFAVTLSGGLDSGSVAVLSARHLAGSGRSLTGYTHVPGHVCDGTLPHGWFGDETAMARSTAAAATGLVHEVVSSRQCPLAAIRDTLAAGAYLSRAPGNAYWLHDLARLARDGGAGVLLTGQGGNGTISWPGPRDAGAGTGLPVLARLRSTMRQREPAALLRSWRHARARAGHWPHTPVRAAYARRIDLAAQMAAQAGRPGAVTFRGVEADVPRAAAFRPGATTFGENWARIASTIGIDVRDPTWDRRVIEYTLAMPARLFRGPGGVGRWAVRRAMAGMLPDPVRLNTGRGWQSAGFLSHLRQSHAEIATVLDVIARGPAAEYLDVPRMKCLHQDVVRGLDVSVTRVHSVLMQGLQAGLWLDERAR